MKQPKQPTQIRIEPNLHKALRIAAIKAGISMNNAVNQAIEMWLKKPKVQGETKSINAHELITVLAALRLWQQSRSSRNGERVKFTFKDRGFEFVELSSEEIDKLCERIK